MSKMSLAWVEAQIEHELERGNHPEAVRDLAALIAVREYLTKHEPKMHHDMMDTTPTLDQVEMAMGALTVNTETDKSRMRDLMTWKQILKED